MPPQGAALEEADKCLPCLQPPRARIAIVLEQEAGNAQVVDGAIGRVRELERHCDMESVLAGHLGTADRPALGAAIRHGYTFLPGECPTEAVASSPQCTRTAQAAQPSYETAVPWLERNTDLLRWR